MMITPSGVAVAVAAPPLGVEAGAVAVAVAPWVGVDAGTVALTDPLVAVTVGAIAVADPLVAVAAGEVAVAVLAALGADDIGAVATGGWPRTALVVAVPVDVGRAPVAVAVVSGWLVAGPTKSARCRNGVDVDVDVAVDAVVGVLEALIFGVAVFVASVLT
jgi:hypothetical protein